MKPDNAQEIPGKKSRPFDIRDFVLRRSVLIVVAGFAIFLALSPIALILRKPYYNTVGTILISPEVQLLVPRDVRKVPGNFREFAMTHAQRIKSQVVLSRILNSLPKEHWPVSLPKELSPEVAAVLLSRQLTVDIVGASRILAVGMNADEPAGLSTTINAIMEGYVRILEHEQERDNERQLSYLAAEKTGISGRIERLRLERKQVSEELQSSSFSETRNPGFEKLVEAQTSFLRASADALFKKAELEKAQRDEEILGNNDLSVFAEELVATNEAVYLIDNWTYQKLQELRSNIDGLTENNSDRIVVEERMQAMTDYLASFKSEMHETMFGILNRKRDFELETDKTKAESAFLAAQSYAETLAEEMRVAEEAFKESSGLVSEGRELSDEIETLTDRLAVLDQRISEVNLEAKAPIFLSVEQLATTPMTPLGDNFGKLLAMIFAASFALVGGSVISFEFLDGRVRAPGDVKAALGAMPLDPVPFVASESTDQDFAKIVSQDPKSSAAGAIRRAIVRLNTEREQNDAKVFCFTGVAEHNGVSSLVSNYADGFYHYTDRVLIIEFVDEGEELPADGGNENGQRPSAPNNGDESATAEAVLNNLPEEGGWVGKISFARQSGIVRKRSEIVKLIEGSRERVDVILLDTRPMLESDLSQFLALLSDSLVIIARRSESQYQSLRNMVEFAFRMEIPTITAVFNASLEQPLDRILHFKRHVIEEVVPSTRSYVENKFSRKRNQKLESQEVEAAAARRDRAVDRKTSSEDDDVVLPG